MTARIDAASNPTPTRSALGQSAGSAWFSHRCDMADDGWSGPHKHIEDALASMVEDIDWEWGQPIYIRRGRKMKKAEMEEWGVEFQWQCDGPSIVVHLPNILRQPPLPADDNNNNTKSAAR